MAEKRDHQRINCAEKCLLYHLNAKYNGSIMNISITGALVSLYGLTPGNILPGDVCSLILSSDPASSLYRYKSRIARVGPKEIGLEILEHEF